VAEPGSQPGFKVWGAKQILIVIICLKQIFLSTTKFEGHKKDLGATTSEFPTMSAGLGGTIARKSSIGGLHVFAWTLDILKIYF